MMEGDRLELCMLLKDLLLVMYNVRERGNVWESSFADLMIHRIQSVSAKWCSKEGR